MVVQVGCTWIPSVIRLVMRFSHCRVQFAKLWSVFFFFMWIIILWFLLFFFIFKMNHQASTWLQTHLIVLVWSQAYPHSYKHNGKCANIINGPHKFHNFYKMSMNLYQIWYQIYALLMLENFQKKIILVCWLLSNMLVVYGSTFTFLLLIFIFFTCCKRVFPFYFVIW